MKNLPDRGPVCVEIDQYNLWKTRGNFTIHIHDVSHCALRSIDQSFSHAKILPHDHAATNRQVEFSGEALRLSTISLLCGDIIMEGFNTSYRHRVIGNSFLVILLDLNICWKEMNYVSE